MPNSRSGFLTALVQIVSGPVTQYIAYGVCLEPTKHADALDPFFYGTIRDSSI